MAVPQQTPPEIEAQLGNINFQVDSMLIVAELLTPVLVVFLLAFWGAITPSNL